MKVKSSKDNIVRAQARITPHDSFSWSLMYHSANLHNPSRESVIEAENSTIKMKNMI